MTSTESAGDITVTTCSPELVTGSSAEVAVRVQATTLNKTIDPRFLYVTCGTVLGKLHKEEFYCPGIHMECVELEDGTMITPRKLVTIAEKERLKDWKTAVRVNGMPIRRYMERGLLDFHDHANRCTMKCLSRTGSAREREQDTSSLTSQDEVLFNPLQLAPSPDYESGDSPPSPVQVKIVQVPLATTNTAVLQKPEYSATTVISDNGRTNRRKQVPTPTSMVQKKQTVPEFDAAELGLFQENEDCQVFWKGILRVGMLDHIVQDIVNEIQTLKKELVMSGVGREEARQFSKIVKQLGISEKIQNKVMSQKSIMHKEKEMLKKEMDDLKKRVAAAEQRQYDLKRKAASLDQLMDFTLKRPALMTSYGAFGMDSDSDSDPLQPEFRQYVKQEISEEASSDTGSFTSHVDQDGDSIPSETSQNRRKGASNMLENVLKKLKENIS